MQFRICKVSVALLPQIRHERGVDLGFMRQNGLFQRDEALPAEGEIQRPAGGEKLPLGGATRCSMGVAFVRFPPS